jgi:hypothetical protein
MRFFSIDMLMVSGEWWVRIDRYEERPTQTDFQPPLNPRVVEALR